MRAVLQRRFGGPEVLAVEDDVPDPIPAPGEVRIAVAAAGVHLIDTAVRAGRNSGPLPPATLPMVPGREVAGRVEAVGGGVDPGLIGEAVAVDLGPRSGGYAELALAEARRLQTIPADMDPCVAVAMVGTGRTTMAILDQAAPMPGDVVLLSAAAGGIGSTLVQLLVDADAVVVGLAGGDAKCDAVRRLGAHSVVDVEPDGWMQTLDEVLEDRAVTLGLDGVGGQTGRAVLERVAVGGRLVMYGSASGQLTQLDASDLFTRGLTVSAAVGARLLGRPERLPELEARALQAAATGLVLPLTQRFRLGDAADAHTAIERRQHLGKVVLLP